ncbi:MAG: ABC transporter permease [Desulfobulbaceae bacterium]|nr:ABC transporter permease [Desulfobulbaceae bacterium]
MFKFFSHIITSTWKETLLLRRDKAGLLVLFFMPAALVIIITLVQENVMELTGEKRSEILFLDQDHGQIATRLRQSLHDSKRITLVELDSAKARRDEAIARVRKGDYQVCIIIPEGTSKRLEARIQRLFAVDAPSAQSSDGDLIPVYFDPSVLPGFRSGILAALQLATFNIEMELKVKALQEKVAALLAGQQLMMGGIGKKPDLGLTHLQENLLTLSEEQAGPKKKENAPSAVQHNIPAWALFGLFFTCIPLAGSLLVERNSGIWIRLMTMPISSVSLLVGKIVGYVGVCFSQILLIVLIGRFIFPLLGLPMFTINGHLAPLVVISLCCSLAACGYGVLLGSICTSIEQASMFGSISIVITASLGGVLVPTYAMPGAMQRISGFSPLNWGLEAYQDVLLRGSSIAQISGDLARLLAFFLVLLLISWHLNRRSQ